MKTDTAFHYRLYDIPVISEIELPELERQEPFGSAQNDPPVVISIGTVPATLKNSVKTEDAWYEVTPTEMTCSVPGIGKFYVSKGRRIVIQPDPVAERNDVRTYLFGVTFAAAVHQRNLLPLHISAVRTPYGVWAFTGDSGAGKSTLVGLLNQLTGWPLLCDDVAVIRVDDGAPRISAGLQRLKLWDDAVEMLGANPVYLVRDLERQNKFHLKDPKLFNTETMPLKALVRLERGDDFLLSRISGAQLFETVMNAIYRPYFVPLFGDRILATITCSKVATKIDGYVYQRPWSLHDQQTTAKALIEHISQS